MNSLKLTVGRAKEMTNQGLRWPVKDKSGTTIKTTRTRDDARKFVNTAADAFDIDVYNLTRSPEATT